MMTSVANGRRLQPALPVIGGVLWVLQVGLLVKASRLLPTNPSLEPKDVFFWAIATCVVLCAGGLAWLSVHRNNKLSRIVLLALPVVGTVVAILVYYVFRFAFRGFSL